MRREAARTLRKVPVSVTSSTLDHCSSVISRMEAVPPRPALLIMTSTPPGVLGEVQQRLDLLLDGDVADGPAHAFRAELGAQLGGGCLQPSGVGVAEHHQGRALLQAAAGGGGADPGAGGGRDDDAAPGEQAVGGDVGGDGLCDALGNHARASLGRPSTRSAMTLRWISSEPP